MIDLPEGEALVRGQLGLPQDTFTLGNTQGDLTQRVQRIDTATLGEFWGLSLMPWALWPESALSDDVQPKTPTAYLTPSRHVGYAVQWFALAVALCVLGFRFLKREGQ